MGTLTSMSESVGRPPLPPSARAAIAVAVITGVAVFGFLLLWAFFLAVLGHGG